MRTSFLRSKVVRGLLAVGAAVAVFSAGGAAQAVLTGTSGGYIERNLVVTENNAYLNSSAAGVWQAVPGMSRSVTIASGTRRAFDTSYTAESQCVGSSGWCSVRVVMINSAGAVTELNPASGIDFAFDSASTDNWESNAINRTSAFMPAGTYTLRVESTKVGSGVSSLRLDEQNFRVGVLRP